MIPEKVLTTSDIQTISGVDEKIVASNPLAGEFHAIMLEMVIRRKQKDATIFNIFFISVMNRYGTLL